MCGNSLVVRTGHVYNPSRISKQPPWLFDGGRVSARRGHRPNFHHVASSNNLSQVAEFRRVAWRDNHKLAQMSL